MPVFLTDINDDYTYKNFFSSFISGDISSIDYKYLENVTKIRSNAFNSYTQLQSISIPKSVSNIFNNAFNSCTNLKQVYYNGTIDDWCSINFSNPTANPLFYGAMLYIGNQLVKDTTINCEKIKDYVFSYYKSLETVTIGNSVTSIGNYAFEYCSNLTSITIGNGVTSIGNYAFYYCSSLTSIIIGNGVTSIGNYAFQNCSSLTSITMGNSVESIGNQAFRNCSSLTSIIIPYSITNIETAAFYNCQSLSYIEYKGTTTEWEDNVAKGTSAFGGVAAVEIICSDGNVPI